MRTRTGEESIKYRGDGAPGCDGLHSVGGGSCGDGGCASSKGSGACARKTNGGNERAVSETPWFAPIEETPEVSECPGGVCPAPWAVDTVDTSVNVFNLPGFPGVVEDNSQDMVNHPPHYTARGGIECIEAIEAQLTPEEYRGYLKGNIAKYVWREIHKGNIQSLKKAQWYLDRLISFDEAQKG